MNNSTIGLIVGGVLAVVAVVLGFWQVLVVAVFMTVGWAVGKTLDGELDVAALVDAVRGRSRS